MAASGADMDNSKKDSSDPKEQDPWLHDPRCNGTDEDVEKMKNILATDPASLDRLQLFFYIKSDDGKAMVAPEKVTPITDAAHAGHVKCVKFLAETGANVKISNNMPPLDQVYRNLLMKLAVDSDEKIDKEKLREDAAIRSEIVEILFMHGHPADVLFSDFFSILDRREMNQSYLRIAVEQGSYKEVEALLKYGASTEHIHPETHKPRYTLPLQQALQSCRMDTVKILMLYGASLELDDEDLTLPFQLPAIAIPDYFTEHQLSLETAANKYMEALRMYQAIGGRFNTLIGDDKGLILNVIGDLKTYRKGRSTKFVNLVLPMLLELLRPMSLKSLARAAIKKHLGKKYMSSIENLNVTPELMPFMKFDDIEISAVEEDKLQSYNEMIQNRTNKMLGGSLFEKPRGSSRKKSGSVPDDGDSDWSDVCSCSDDCECHDESGSECSDDSDGAPIPCPVQ